MRSWEDRVTVWSVRMAAITDDLQNHHPKRLAKLQKALRPTLSDLAVAIRRRDGDRVAELISAADAIVDRVVPDWKPKGGMALTLDRLAKAHA